MRRLGIVVLLVVAAGCGSGPERVPAVTSDMDCAEVAEVVEGAIARSQRYIGSQESDAVLAADLVFALSGAEERPECIDDDVRRRASGLRATLWEN